MKYKIFLTIIAVLLLFVLFYYPDNKILKVAVVLAFFITLWGESYFLKLINKK